MSVSLSRLQHIRRLRPVARQALARFGVEPASFSLLSHVFNTTFAVTDTRESRYVLHILRHDMDEESPETRRVRAESELWWLDRLREDLDLPVPSPVRTPSREGAVDIADSGMPRPWLCTLFRWVDGRSIRGHLTPRHLEAVGRLTARLHDHSAHLTVPSWFDRPRVDPTGPEVEEEAARTLTEYGSPEGVTVVREVFCRVRQAQKALGDGPSTYSLIHADIHQWNYLFDGQEARLIDFGDCGWGHYLYDLAVTLDNLPADPHHSALRAALLSGYRQEHPLSAAHEALIDDFILLREVQDLTWFVRDRDDPLHNTWTDQIEERVAGLRGRLAATE